MTTNTDQPFEADHQHLLRLLHGDPKRRSLALGPRACWYQRPGRSGAPWQMGIALAWDCQPDFTAAIIETAPGEVLSLSIEVVRFQPPIDTAA